MLDDGPFTAGAHAGWQQQPARRSSSLGRMYAEPYFPTGKYGSAYMTGASRSKPDPLLHGLSRSLREARIRRGLSQQQLAQMAGVPRLRVIDIERGSPGVAIGAYARVAQSLGLQAYRRPVFEDLKETFR